MCIKTGISKHTCNILIIYQITNQVRCSTFTKPFHKNFVSLMQPDLKNQWVEKNEKENIASGIPARAIWHGWGWFQGIQLFPRNDF